MVLPVVAAFVVSGALVTLAVLAFCVWADWRHVRRQRAEHRRQVDRYALRELRRLNNVREGDQND